MIKECKPGTQKCDHKVNNIRWSTLQVPLLKSDLSSPALWAGYWAQLCPTCKVWHVLTLFNYFRDVCGEFCCSILVSGLFTRLKLCKIWNCCGGYWKCGIYTGQQTFFEVDNEAAWMLNDQC